MKLFLLVVIAQMFPFSFWKTSAPMVVVDTVITPSSQAVTNSTTISCSISTTTTGAHLFYTTNGFTPAHTGDTAGAWTTRVASNSTLFNVTGTNQIETITAIGYQMGYTDSAPASVDYTFGTPP